jgi:DNA-binding NarL/FixJ family response regulator
MTKRILLIEDHDQMRENLTLLLELSGYNVTGAANGRAGLDIASASPPDLILCDVMMPELDGYGVLAGVRADPDLNSIPFIFLTAKGEKRDLREGMNLGADDYLTKPVTEADLLAALDARWQRLSALRQRQSAYHPDFSSHLPLLALGLTDREAEVLLWVAQGKSSPDLAVILGMSPATAKKHVCNVLMKLGCETRSAATLRALEVLSSGK